MNEQSLHKDETVFCILKVIFHVIYFLRILLLRAKAGFISFRRLESAFQLFEDIRKVNLVDVFHVTFRG